MIKEFIPAVEWLEQDYDQRDSEASQRDSEGIMRLFNSHRGGWRMRSRVQPDGSPLHHEADRNVYRQGLYQIVDDVSCGDNVQEICQDETGVTCIHPEHDEIVNCYCFGGTPKYIWGMDWTEEDDKVFLEEGNYFGVIANMNAYVLDVHPYIERIVDKPNNIEWWKEEAT